MNRETYDSLKNLVYKVDDLSKSADTINEILSGFKKPDCLAKIFFYEDGRNYQIDLASKTAKKVFQIILKEYYGHIEESRNEINCIIDSITKR